MRRSPVLLLALLALAPSVAATSPADAGSVGSAPDSGSPADFNGDGFDDLAVGIPYETISGESSAGAVNVLYGTSRGLSAADTQLWHQDKRGIKSDADAGDTFGYSLAPADFNGDGYSDLAVGAKDESVSGEILAGAINVIYGSPAGLVAAGDQFWHRDRKGIRGDAEIAHQFGYSMTAGDFNGDGFGDLAAGTPYSHTSGQNYAGNASVIYGSPTGLRAEGNQFWSQDSDGVQDDAEEGDGFGSSLVAGDFDGDGRSDLAIGTGHEGIGDIDHAGAVNLLYGSVTGLSAARDQIWHQDMPGVEGSADHEEAFGWFALAAGDFNGDQISDLAVGLPDEHVNETWAAGSTNVLYGSSAGLSAVGDQAWNQDSAGIDSDADLGDKLGYDLAVGDFDGDGYDDLAAGVPGESVTYVNEGAVSVIYGGSAGLSAARNQFWNQDSPGVVDKPEESDFFAITVAAADWGNGPEADLAIGVIYETIVGDGGYEGAVHALYGTATGGLSASGSQFWHQGVKGIPDDLEFNDFYGYELS